jgi:hypothetical protein
MTPWIDRVDHLVYAVPDLTAGVARVEQLLGVAATPGGQHPGRGTRNALIAIGPRIYIEIIGPDREQPPPQEPRPFGIDGLTEPRLITWAANANDLASLVHLATSRRVVLGDLQPASRRRPDGTLLTWRYTNPRTIVADGVVPFFIDWGTTSHPAEGAVSGGRLIDLRAEHPRADDVVATLRALGLPMKVTNASTPRLVATIQTPNGERREFQ